MFLTISDVVKHVSKALEFLEQNEHLENQKRSYNVGEKSKREREKGTEKSVMTCRKVSHDTLQQAMTLFDV